MHSQESKTSATLLATAVIAGIAAGLSVPIAITITLVIRGQGGGGSLDLLDHSITGFEIGGSIGLMIGVVFALISYSLCVSRKQQERIATLETRVTELERAEETTERLSAMDGGEPKTCEDAFQPPTGVTRKVSG
jgi:hypothetical protein